MKTISKELLNDVLKDNINIHLVCGVYDNQLEYQYIEENRIFKEYISIHDLEHKCRKWAFYSGYEIVQLSKSVKIYKNGIEVFYLFSKTDDKEIYSMDMIFKCYQWILENKDK